MGTNTEGELSKTLT